MSTALLFERLSGWTWDVLEAAHLQRVRFGEDAVASMLAVAINRFGPDGVVVADVRGSEPSDGADVEIWFVHKDGYACGFSVQAKMVDAGPLCGGSYKHLDHPPGSIYKQVDRLIATSDRIGTTPVYALFNHRSALPAKGIGLRPCGRGARYDQLGCTVVEATVVRHALRTGRWGWKRMERFHGPSGSAVPLRCAVCTCPAASRRVRKRFGSPCLDRLPNRVDALIDAGRVVGVEVGDLLGAGSRSEALRRPGTTEIDDRPRFLVVVPYVMTSDPLG